MNNERFDQWFDDAFDVSASSSSLFTEESKKESWKKVQVQIHKMNKSKNRKRHFHLAAVVAASVTAGAIIFNPPAITQAGSPVYSSIKDWGNGVVSVIFGTSTSQTGNAKTSAPPDIYPEDKDNPTAILESVSESQSMVLTIEEVQNHISFAYPNFQNIPIRFHLASAELPPLDSATKFDDVTMTYRTENNEIMRIMVQSLAKPMVSSSSGSGEIETLTLTNDIEAYYTPGRFNQIQFLYNGLKIQIYGKVTKEELLQMVESLPR